MTAIMALAGCSTAPAAGGTPGASQSPPLVVKNVVACQAIAHANAIYQPQLAAPGEPSDTRMLRTWSDQITAAAIPLDDPILKAQLLSLADTIQGWVTRPPSKVQAHGYADDVGRACGRYLDSGTASATP